jgi:hypothetical protein
VYTGEAPALVLTAVNSVASLRHIGFAEALIVTVGTIVGVTLTINAEEYTGPDDAQVALLVSNNLI